MHEHPRLQINDFISPLFLKPQKESFKMIFLLGDFNIGLLEYELADPINNFIDTLHISLHKRISKALHYLITSCQT